MPKVFLHLFSIEGILRSCNEDSADDLCLEVYESQVNNSSSSNLLGCLEALEASSAFLVM